MHISSNKLLSKIALKIVSQLFKVPRQYPVRTPGFKSRIRPPYSQRVVKGD